VRTAGPGIQIEIEIWKEQRRFDEILFVIL